MSNLNNIVTYFPNFLKEKDMIFYAIILLTLLLTVSFGTSKLAISYQEAQETELQIATMQNFLNEWTEKTKIVNQATYRPVKAIQIDDVQTSILLALQANQLDVISFKAVTSSKKEENSHMFEIEFAGSFESTIHLLNNFHAKDALLSIHNLKMEPNKGKIKTTMQYKIYAK
ncbi:MAG: hypothetical protein H6Q70_117 [Firmicutes bacterium]|nr:hypothetical protein [Bacillota bacterium]